MLAAVFFAVGLYFAILSYRLIYQTGINQANFLGRMAQITILIFTGAVALREIGVAEDIINLAFGISLGAIAIAVAIAFGVGSTKIAEREVENFLTAMRAPKEQKDEG